MPSSPPNGRSPPHEQVDTPTLGLMSAPLLQTPPWLFWFYDPASWQGIAAALVSAVVAAVTAVVVVRFTNAGALHQEEHGRLEAVVAETVTLLDSPVVRADVLSEEERQRLAVLFLHIRLASRSPELGELLEQWNRGVAEDITARREHEKLAPLDASQAEWTALYQTESYRAVLGCIQVLSLARHRLGPLLVDYCEASRPMAWRRRRQERIALQAIRQEALQVAGAGERIWNEAAVLLDIPYVVDGDPADPDSEQSQES